MLRPATMRSPATFPMVTKVYPARLDETASNKVLAMNISIVKDSSGWLKHLDIFSATKLRHLALS
jgi:hypothetical protein